jgi:hypothetical protein
VELLERIAAFVAPVLNARLRRDEEERVIGVASTPADGTTFRVTLPFAV